MVDPDPGYRPRRAFVDPSAAQEPAAEVPAEEPTPPVERSGAAAEDIRSVPATGSAEPPPGTGPRGASPLPAADAAGPAADPDQPKPLYRDEAARSGPGSTPEALSEETRVVRPLNFRQRQRRTADDEDATTLLPRTGSGSRRPADRDEDDLDDEPHRRLLGARGRLALLIGAMAAVIAVGIAVIYAVSTVGNPTADPSATDPSAPVASSPGTPAPDPSTLLDESQLLSAAAAEPIDPRRTWEVALTQRPPAAEAPLPACLGDQPAEGEPTAQQKVVRVLSSSGKEAPSVLHQATAYASADEAAQAYAVATRTFGGCAAPGSFIVSGATVSGLGDQAVAVVVDVITDGKTRLHSVVLSRTGSVVDVVDAAQAGRALPGAGVAKALAAVVTAQCQPAGGACAAEPVLKDAPPPLGGDEPGFLATGDLPPAGEEDETWLATPAEEPSDSFQGSQCETVTWSRLGESASSRVYLVPSSTTFGLNDIVLTMKDEKAARDLVAEIKADLESCAKRTLTATVSEPAPVRGPGARGSTVAGWTSTVTQKSGDGDQRYRVGIVSSGPKVAYTFLNPLAGGYDLTQAEWDRVAVRAGQRMTQVP